MGFSGSPPDIQTCREAHKHLRNPKNLEKPFFMAVGFHKPHIPLRFPEEYLDLYPLEAVKGPKNPRRPGNLPEIFRNPWTDLRRRDDINSLDFSCGIRQSNYAATSYIDDLIGPLVKDTTAIWYWRHFGDSHEWSRMAARLGPEVVKVLQPPKCSKSSFDGHTKTCPQTF